MQRLCGDQCFFFSRALYRAALRPVRNDESPGKNFFLPVFTLDVSNKKKGESFNTEYINKSGLT